MGTDIHLQVEAKINGEWKWLNDNLPKGIDLSSYVPLDTSRNYNLFAILANVRNGYGFAGCDTGDGFVPISEPKGLPKDISTALKARHEEQGLLGDHSFSWLNAKELEDYDWDRVTKRRGWVKKDQFLIWKVVGKPKSWCGGVSGKNVKHISNKEMEKIEDNLDNSYTEVEWEESYKEAVGWNNYYKYSDLKTLISWDEDGEKIEDIRIVFGFDS